MVRSSVPGRIRTGGVILGIGMGAFVDGVLLHQILQWHNMLSSVLPPTTLEAMRTNMLWDGLLHAFAWVATLAGILVLWGGTRIGARAGGVLPSASWLIGLMLIGWGIFNFFEGIIDHHILGIHHVRMWGFDPVWDTGFLLTAPLLVGLGWLLTRPPG